MAKIVVEMTGEQAKLHQAVMAAVADQAKLEKGVDKVAKQSRKAAKAEAELARAAKRVYEETRTPQEQYKARMARLNNLLQRGKINQDTYGRAARNAGEQLRMAGNKGQAAGEKLRRAGDKGQAAFGPKALGMLRSFAGALGITAGVAGAVQLVRKEWEALIAVQERAKETSLSVADAQNAALRNLGADTVAERDAFISEVKAVSKEAGVSQQFVYNLASSALSARGNLTVAQAMHAVKQAALYAPDSPGAGEALAGAALDIGKFTGATPEQALGFATEVGKMARPTATGKIVENAAPAIAGAMQSGATPRSGAAAWAALTGGMVDPQGRKAKTATLALASQLAEFLPAEDVYGIATEGGKKGQKILARRGTGLRTMEDRIAFLQQNADKRLEFWADASFEKIAKPSVVQLLEGKGATAEAYKQFSANLPLLKDSGPIFKRRLAIQRGAPLQETAAFSRELLGNKERRQTTGRMQLPARMAIMRKELAEAYPELGERALGTFVEQFRSSGSWMRKPGSLDYWKMERQHLSNVVGRLKNPTSGEFDWKGFLTGGMETLRRPPTPLETEQAESGERLLAKLDQLILALEKNAASTDHNSTETKPPSRPTLAPMNQKD